MTPDQIRLARKMIAASQSQLADIMGISVRTLQGWECGRKKCGELQARAIESATGYRRPLR